jgi:hypothetical protein
VNFHYSENVNKLPEWAESKLQTILTSSGVFTAVITSTTRNPHDQARVMYDSLEIHGEKAQRKLYKGPGNEVISVWQHQKALGRNREGVMHEMELKIIEAGPSGVSRHCSNDPNLSVIDIAPSSIPVDMKRKFENAVKQASGVSKFLFPPGDPAYHIEMKNTIHQ